MDFNLLHKKKVMHSCIKKPAKKSTEQAQEEEGEGDNLK